MDDCNCLSETATYFAREPAAVGVNRGCTAGNNDHTNLTRESLRILEERRRAERDAEHTARRASRGPPPREVGEWVLTTCVMDWPAWGETLEMAVEEFALAIRIAWPHLSPDVERIIRQAPDVGPEEAFGLLQDLVEVRVVRTKKEE